MLAAFDGSLTLLLVLLMMTVGIDWRLGLAALIPFPLMAYAFWKISDHVHVAWQSSLSRDDSGSGACELVYVCSLDAR